jgi:hypothetical protein
MPTLTDSRLGPGTMSLGSTDYGTQVSNVRLVPSNDTADGTPTLGIPTPPPLITTTWELQGEAIQDWENADGFVEYCRTNNNTTVAFSWVPNTGKGVTYSGQCTITAVEIGGDVASQLTTSFTFAVVGDVARAAGAGTPAPASTK